MTNGQGGADTLKAWWRAPWTLAIAGAPDVAAAMLGSAEREALQDDGDFRPGPYRGGNPRQPGLPPLAARHRRLALRAAQHCTSPQRPDAQLPGLRRRLRP